MNVKQKTVSGFFWSFTDNVLNYLVFFIVGLVLARLLEPAEFGLIGMITIFISISQSFIDSGFTQALIRKKNVTEIDFSTVFYFNLAIGITFYLLLVLFSGTISDFYKEDRLTPIIKVFGLILIINSFTIIQRAKLTKAINFKLQTKISFTSSVLSGIIGIYLAYSGYGVWSLVWRSLINQTLQSLTLWYFNKWLPKLVFSIKSFKELFTFGSKLLLSGLIDTIYRNIYSLIIGKFYSAQELGFYTRADQFQKLPSQNITSTVQRVSYPVLSTLQDDTEKIKTGYKKIIKSTMFITFSSMLCMASISKAMIIVLIGEKWLPAVSYLQLLCFAGILFPLHAINLNILNVKGRSDLFLRLEIIKKILAIPVIVIGIYAGIHWLIIGMIFHSIGCYFVNSYYSAKLINYPLKEQIVDILPTFIITVFVAVIIYIPTAIIILDPKITLLLQVISGIFLIILFAEFFKLDGYLEIKSVFSEIIKRKNNYEQ